MRFSEKTAAAKELQARQKNIDAHRPLYLNQHTFTSHLFFGPYVFFPIISALVWLGGILALLALWVKAGKPRYQPDEPYVVFISDTGAAHKTLFIIICCITSAFYILSLFAERWLRHVDRLPTDVRRREKIFDWVAIIFTIIGSAGLILLSIFDAFNHSTVHWAMTLVFIVGVAISAIFQSAEVWSLHKDHPDRRHLLRNALYKLAVVGLAVACAIAFGVTYGISGGGSATSDYDNRIGSVAAGFEWAVAFILPFYFLTLAADLWPAGKSSPRYMRRLARWQEKHDPSLEHDFTGRRAFAEHPEAWRGADGNAMDPNATTGAGMAPPMAHANSQEMASARPSTAYGSEAGLVQPNATYDAHRNQYNQPGAAQFQSNHAQQNPVLSSAPITRPADGPAGAAPDGATFNAHTGTWNV